jgi:hypothetical protein
VVVFFFQPLAFDELVFYQTINQNSWFGMLKYVREHDTQMPLYYILMKFIDQFFTNNPKLLRGVNLIFSLGTLYLISRRRDKSFLVLASPVFILYSVFLRPYALLAFSFVLVEHLFHKVCRKKNSLSLMLYYSGLLLLSLTHYFGFMAAVLHFIVKFSPRRFIPRRYSLILLLVLGGGMLLVSDFFTDLSVRHSYRNLEIKKLGEVMGLLFGGRYMIIGTVLALFAVGWNKANLHYRKSDIALLLSIFLIPVGISFFNPILESRYFIFILPLFYSFINLSKLSKVRGYIFHLVFLCFGGHELYVKHRVALEPYSLDSERAVEYIAEQSSFKEKVKLFSCNICLFLSKYESQIDQVCTSDRNFTPVDDSEFRGVKKVLLAKVDFVKKTCLIEQRIKSKFEFEKSTSFKNLTLYEYSYSDVPGLSKDD